MAALSDGNLDVRKAAVLALAPWAAAPDVAAALRDALADTDADVRAHAGKALSQR
ncbi:HEAT repeat domain-containing protein [Nonomuraea sp. NPDC001023]|uniref:HEAT repeat domain-containing protein n=1 Tax=Nonomuraea sp. NPDC001023 TaxID=3154770 RepID=UPI00332F2002